MFEDFRKQTDESSFLDDDSAQGSGFDSDIAARQSPQYFLGMTPPQRLILAIMLLFMAIVLGAFCLLVTETVVPPFLG